MYNFTIHLIFLYMPLQFLNKWHISAIDAVHSQFSKFNNFPFLIQVEITEILFTTTPSLIAKTEINSPIGTGTTHQSTRKWPVKVSTMCSLVVEAHWLKYGGLEFESQSLHLKPEAKFLCYGQIIASNLFISVYASVPSLQKLQKQDFGSRLVTKYSSLMFQVQSQPTTTTQIQRKRRFITSKRNAKSQEDTEKETQKLDWIQI